jgi:hypothetical protein
VWGGWCRCSRPRGRRRRRPLLLEARAGRTGGLRRPHHSVGLWPRRSGRTRGRHLSRDLRPMRRRCGRGLNRARRNGHCGRRHFATAGTAGMHRAMGDGVAIRVVVGCLHSVHRGPRRVEKPFIVCRHDYLSLLEIDDARGGRGAVLAIRPPARTVERSEHSGDAGFGLRHRLAGVADGVCEIQQG